MAEPLTTQVSVDQLRTNSGYEVSNLNFVFEKTNQDSLNYKIQGGILNGVAETKSIQLQRLNISTQFYYFSTQGTLLTGISSRTMDDKPTSQFGEVTLNLNHKISETTSLVFDAGYLTFADILQTRKAFEDFTRGTFARLALQARPFDRLRVSTFHQSTWFSDDNQRLQTDLGVLYGIATGSPWIWLGVGGERLTNTLQATSYWTPRGFTSYGPRLDLAIPLTEKLSFSTGLNINQFNDDDAGSGTGYYVFSRAVYSVSKTWQWELSYEGIKSKQGGAEWTSDAGRIGSKWDF